MKVRTTSLLPWLKNQKAPVRVLEVSEKELQDFFRCAFPIDRVYFSKRSRTLHVHILTPDRLPVCPACGCRFLRTHQRMGACSRNCARRLRYQKVKESAA